MNEFSLNIIPYIIVFTLGCATNAQTSNKIERKRKQDPCDIINELRYRLKQTSALLSNATFINNGTVVCSDVDFDAGRCFAAACAPCNLTALNTAKLCTDPGPLGTGNLCLVGKYGKPTSSPCCIKDGASCQRSQPNKNFYNVLKGVSDSSTPDNYSLFEPLEDRHFDDKTKRCLIRK
ncbi:hypothetical protein [Pseudoalteromonas sp. NBT06-2]|uniref:hypothetical protein n=1 Tax=Pseudoalteromonas sp. NBT06-2 TaxID=2025950 RepID=UPI0011409532|nr:hypothetical protein [Pseudoalteromonas sp. NBT06-2]